MNKTKTLINICISCMMVMLFIFNYSGVSYAEESKTLSFNSVVEVESYSLEEEYLEAGKDATVLLVLHNVNVDSAAKNIILSVSSNSGLIYPLYGNDNQFFIGTLEADGRTTVKIPLSVSSRLIDDYVEFNCSITYENNGTRVSNSSSLILPIRNNDTVSVSSVDVSAQAKVNSKSLLSIVYANTGTNSINDATVFVKGNVSEESKKINLDSIAAGKSYAKDFSIVFTESGEQKISILLSYTGIYGEHVESELGDYIVNVSEEKESWIPRSTERGSFRMLGRVISLMAFVMASMIIFLYIKKR
ncbi:hypothetical protein [Oribacterium sp. P6A1]|uniref:hypothetical protein n=1 Tax=Oribacterium sp. P6A1 TaxID=1410612 RepID=UPI000A9C35B2|nr:hypothetical protein [Oribacterium sp. P6A1]